MISVGGSVVFDPLKYQPLQVLNRRFSLFYPFPVLPRAQLDLLLLFFLFLNLSLKDILTKYLGISAVVKHEALFFFFFFFSRDH